jgi:hypothetical protein
LIGCKEAAPHLLHLHKISNQRVKWHLQQFWDPFTDDNFQLAAHLQPSGKEKAT